MKAEKALADAANLPTRILAFRNKPPNPRNVVLPFSPPKSKPSKPKRYIPKHCEKTMKAPVVDDFSLNLLDWDINSSHYIIFLLFIDTVVRVLRLWSVYSFMKPDQVNLLQMVLIDEKGATIHATVRRQMLYLFRLKITEGEVYKMSFFTVSPESDRYGLSLTSIGDICGHGPDHDFLVDVVGLITGISAEREYICDGKVTKMILLELTDNREYIYSKCFECYKIYGDPSIPEIVAFKESLAVDGLQNVSSIPTIGPHGKPSLEEDFLVKYPKTSIANLLGADEDGVYVVGAVVDGLVDAEEWWYPACSCHRSVTADSGAYYCTQCVKHVFRMVPRFRVKLRVDDGSGQAVFVVFDNDMNHLLGKHCHELVAASKVVISSIFVQVDV
ncbi:hypothetical protein TSUD_275800 [Trifolium subterraneum]|uniref:Replication factor A C-terminal domain-containing protein n=1 Tax=Trifolium subterraneum TaxID=3900 RepID=A0A2Z6MBH3_TRISU|nr:hypothetical protein TSUD_275800 [Trifolium subterraneum]